MLPPPPPPPKRPFDQDEEPDPEPERETVRIITYRDAVHIRQQLAAERTARRVFWLTLAIGSVVMAAAVAGWWAYTEWFRGGVIQPYHDPEPPTVLPTTQR